MAKAIKLSQAEVTKERVVQQYPAIIYEKELQDDGITLLIWKKLLEKSRLGSWANVEEVYVCSEYTTEKKMVNIFLKTRSGAGLTNFRRIPALDFLIPAGPVEEEILKFLSGQLR